MTEGMPDLSGLLAQAQQMQAQLAATQEQLALERITGQAGGGLVQATVTGAGELVGLSIASEAADPDDTETLADLVLAAYRDASNQAAAHAAASHGAARAGARRPRSAGDLADVRRHRPRPHRRARPVARVSGPKSAQRIAFHLLAAEPADVRRLAEVLLEVKAKVRFCRVCGNVAESDECRICHDPRRDLSVICVVEESKDVVAVERTREFRGRYHVLGGAISPIEGIGPDDLRVKELMTRLADGTVTELILATDPNLEGEATATYLARLVKPMGLTVSRLASGLPVGGDLEYADEVTLGRAFEGRRSLEV